MYIRTCATLISSPTIKAFTLVNGYTRKTVTTWIDAVS